MWLNVHGFLSENLEATERALAAAVYIGGICIGMVISMSSLFTSQKMSFRGRSPYQKELVAVVPTYLRPNYYNQLCYHLQGDSLLLSVGLRIFRAWRHSLLFAEKIFSLYFYLKVDPETMACVCHSNSFLIAVFRRSWTADFRISHGI